MMKTDLESSLREELLDGILENLRLLEGAELEAYLLELGLDPDDLLASFDAIFHDPAIAAKRRIFEAARKRSQVLADAPSALILSLDSARKREIFATVKKHADATGDMTIAARNRRIESEEDLDSLLEAWLRLGVIDESGNLKE
jgi:hypothetical protein